MLIPLGAIDPCVPPATAIAAAAPVSPDKTDAGSEVEVEVVMNEAETTALYHMIYNAEGKDGSTEVVASLPGENEAVVSAVERLLGSIDEITAYVDDVVSGKKQGSPTVGLALYDALSALQSYKQEEKVMGPPSYAISIVWSPMSTKKTSRSCWPGLLPPVLPRGLLPTWPIVLQVIKMRFSGC